MPSLRFNKKIKNKSPICVGQRSFWIRIQLKNNFKTNKVKMVGGELSSSFVFLFDSSSLGNGNIKITIAAGRPISSE